MKFAKTSLLLGVQLGSQLVQVSFPCLLSVVILSNPYDYFTFILTEALSLANGGGAATSEVLRIASQIVPGDFDGWFNEFDWIGDQIYDLARQAKTPISRRGALFRAASYWRLSSFFLVGNASDPRLYSKWDIALDAFNEAISLLPIPGENLTIRASDFDVPTYFFKASTDCKKLPTMIMGTGYDGSQQEAWHALGLEAFNRGWNFVTYEGPGQPTVRRQQNLGFRPDWWTVITPIVDYLATRPDVDMDNLVYLGESFGGQLAPIVVSQEHRFKAVISIDGLADMAGVIFEAIGTELQSIYASGNATLFDEAIAEAISTPPLNTEFIWFVSQGLWAFDTDSYYDWLTQLSTFSLSQGLVDNITTKYRYVGEGQNDYLTVGQPELLMGYYDNSTVANNATLNIFSTNLGSGEHCQLGAEPQLAQQVFDWLFEIFGV
ncbi:Alpha/Beta hydrolase protein [Xylariales sp. PMI_506]|nr:Alpha/Beta hydrolase protein [Xylariales sp. PMI_506]